MCIGGGVMAGIGAGLSALSGTAQSLMGDQAAYEQQKRANDIQRAQYLAEGRSRDLQAQSIYDQADEEALQTNAQAAADKGEIAKEAEKRVAQQRAASSYAGLSGSTANRLVSEINIDSAENKGTIESNRQNTMIQLTKKKESAYNSAYMQPLQLVEPEAPNFAGALLGGLVSGGVNAFSAWKSTNRQINMYNNK